MRKIRFLLNRSIAALACGAAAAGVLSAFSRPPSKGPALSRTFELAIRETRNESVYDAPRDSILTLRFESSLSHYGRIDVAVDTRNSLLTVFTDSLRFESVTPFRLVALLRRDSVEVTSPASRRALQTGGFEMDDAMLACLFEGPSLRITVPDRGGSAIIDHMKADCSGGLYRRLSLPVTMGVFAFRTQSKDGESSGRSQRVVTCPSFSGLGHFPQLRFDYQTRRTPPGETARIEISCDTTLANVRAVPPNSDAVDIIADRIRVRGVVQPWPDTAIMHDGRIEIEEDVRYSRRVPGSPVLRKTCRVEIEIKRR